MDTVWNLSYVILFIIFTYDPAIDRIHNGNFT